jgi:hypothetical protein
MKIHPSLLVRLENLLKGSDKIAACAADPVLLATAASRSPEKREENLN